MSGGMLIASQVDGLPSGIRWKEEHYKVDADLCHPMSPMCRSLPPATRFSVTANEKTDPQILYVSDREVAEAAPHKTLAGGNLRPESAAR